MVGVLVRIIMERVYELNWNLSSIKWKLFTLVE
jgi:hypothetical protein